MGYWGWRPLLSTLVIAVWITGCSLTSHSALVVPPTHSPQVTLILRVREITTPTPAPIPPSTATEQPDKAEIISVYVVRPGDTLSGIALDFGLEVEQLKAANPAIEPLALQVGQEIQIPAPGDVIAAATPLPLQIDLPACYDLITDRMLCLGKVTNPLDQSVAHVRVRVRLRADDGGVLAEAATGVEQAIIPPGQSAPYSVIFPIAARNGTQAAADLLTASPVTGENLITLAVIHENARVVGSRYRVAATVFNDTGTPVEQARVVLTLLDPEGQIVGFRVITISGGLEPDTQIPFEIEAVAQASSKGLTHQLYAEARLVSD